MASETDSTSAVVTTEINVIMETGDRPGDVTGGEEIPEPGVEGIPWAGRREVRGSLGMRWMRIDTEHAQLESRLLRVIEQHSLNGHFSHRQRENSEVGLKWNKLWTKECMLPFS